MSRILGLRHPVGIFHVPRRGRHVQVGVGMIDRFSLLGMGAPHFERVPAYAEEVVIPALSGELDPEDGMAFEGFVP